QCERALVFTNCIERINYRGITLQQHSFLQAIGENSCYQRTFLGLGSFPLHKRCQRHHRQQGSVWHAIGGEISQGFAELVHHLGSQFSRGSLTWQIVGSWEEEAFQSFCSRGKIEDFCDIARSL